MIVGAAPRLLAALLVAAAATAAQGPQLHTSLGAGLEAAAEDDGVALVAFVSVGCGACRAFDQDLAHGRIVLPESLVVVRLDTATARLEANTWGVTAVPTFACLSGDGVILVRQAGYGGPAALAQQAAAALRRHARGEWAGIAGIESLAALDLPALIQALGDPAAERRSAAIAALVGRREGAVPALLAALRHPLLAHRIGADLALRQLGFEPAFDPWDRAAAREEAARVAAETWRADPQLPEPDGVPPVVVRRIRAALADFAAWDDPPRRTAAMAALVQEGAAALPAVDRAAAAAVAAGDERRAALLKDVRWAILVPDELEDAAGVRRVLARGRGETRRQAVERIAGHPRALPALKRLSGDGDPLVRELAVAALQKNGSREAVAAMAALCAADDANSRMVAAAALGKTRQQALAGATLAGMVDDGDEVVACTAIDALLELKAQDQGAALVAALADGRWRVRAAAAKALGTLKVPTGAEALSRALADSDAFVVRNALEALGTLGHHPPAERVQALVERLPDLVAPAVELLLKGSPDIPTIIGLYRSADPDHRRQLLATVQDKADRNEDGEGADQRWCQLWDLVLAEGDADQKRLLGSLVLRQGVDLGAPYLEKLLADEAAEVVSATAPAVAAAVCWHWGVADSAGRTAESPTSTFGILFRATEQAGKPAKPAEGGGLKRLLARVTGDEPPDEAPPPPPAHVVAAVRRQHARWHELLAPHAAAAGASPLVVLATAGCADRVTPEPVLAALEGGGWYAALKDQDLVIRLPRLLLRRLPAAARRPCFDALAREPQLVARWLRACDQLPPGIQDFLLVPAVVLAALHRGDEGAREQLAGALLQNKEPQSLNGTSERAGALRRALAADEAPLARALAAFARAELEEDLGGLEDPDIRVRSAVFQGLLLRREGPSAEVRAAAAKVLEDPSLDLATAAAAVLIDPAIREAAGYSQRFRFGEMDAYAWRSSSGRDGPLPPAATDRPPWLAGVRERLRGESAKEHPLWRHTASLLLLQYGDASGVLDIMPAWLENPDWSTTRLMTTAARLVDDPALLPIARHQLAEADRPGELMEVLALIGRQRGAEARQLRREINWRLSGVKR